MKKTALIFALILIASTFLFARGNKTAKDSTDKKIDYAFIPMLSYNNSFGGQIGFMANGFFDINKADTISPGSMVGVFGSYFTNNTFFTGIINRNYFAEDKWRTKSVMVYGNIEFQTYFDLPGCIPPITALDDNGLFVDYNTKITLVYFSGIRQIIKHWYGGLQVLFTKTVTDFSTGEIPIPTETENLFGFGLVTEYDNRDNVMNPYFGMNAKLSTTSYLESFGSSSQYHRIEIEMNKYFHLNSKSVIMGRIYGIASMGDVPFSGRNVVGRDDMRGYSNGRYRANQVYNIQTEYRWNFYKKWGMVAFGGLGVATDDFKGENYSGVLPAIGTGIRFKAIKKRNINIGVDVAKGKNDWGLYFRIGEAFTM
jgi:hypothetical protein